MLRAARHRQRGERGVRAQQLARIGTAAHLRTQRATGTLRLHRVGHGHKSCVRICREAPAAARFLPAREVLAPRSTGVCPAIRVTEPAVGRHIRERRRPRLLPDRVSGLEERANVCGAAQQRRAGIQICRALGQRRQEALHHAERGGLVGERTIGGEQGVTIRRPIAGSHEQGETEQQWSHER